MTFNLLRERWLPIRTRSGVRLIRPSEIVGAADEEPLSLAYPRPDLECAAHEFLIGLLSVACAPATDEAWRAWWREPPTVDTLDAAFAPFERAFELDGDGPRFLQELGEIDGEALPVDALLIDTPGANAAKKNSDLLTHRARYPAVSRAAAAMMLYAMQAMAPAGGAGIRVSLRGGGPMSLLVLPTSEDPSTPPPLWRTLWANVLETSRWPKFGDEQPVIERLFPWLSPPLEGDVSSADPRVHPLQAFFGMPRRFRLVFGDAPALCPILGVEDPRPVIGLRQTPRGIDYATWTHPMTPYRRQKEGETPYSAKPKPGRLGYRDWTAAVVGDGDGGLRLAAQTAHAAATRSSLLNPASFESRPRVRVAGWAMNNMEATEFLIAEQPLHIAPNPELAETVAWLARKMAEAGDIGHALLRTALKAALFGEDAKVATDKAVFDEARIAFFDGTDAAFHRLLSELCAETDPSTLPDRMSDYAKAWLRELSSAALEIYVQLTPPPLRDPAKATRVVDARRNLELALRGYGGLGKKLFGALDLPAPKPTRTSQKKEVAS